jgi:hypothetical protein
MLITIHIMTSITLPFRFLFFDNSEQKQHYADPQLAILPSVTSLRDPYVRRHNSVDTTTPAAR